MVEPHCFYCQHAEGECPEGCVEWSEFVPTKEANAIRPKLRKVPIEEDEE